MKHILAIGILSLFSFFAQAEIYKWTDENGRVHFGDQPHETIQTETVNVEINTYTQVHITPFKAYQPSKQKKRGGETVIMYATEWCGYCKKARKYFKANNIKYVEYDIEKNDKANREHKALGGRGVPVILYGDKRMNGFSVDGFKRIYGS